MMREKRLQDIFLLVSCLAVNIGLSTQQVILGGITNQAFDRGGTAFFTVSLDPSVEEPGEWTKDGNVLSNIPSKILLLKTAKGRQLVVYSLQETDVGLYTFTIRGESTSAYLSIRGSASSGVWSEWAEWTDVGTCPVTCGTSTSYYKERTRVCNNPNGGQDCSGDSREISESIPCGPSGCPVDCGWSAWTQWGRVTCPVTCGSGQGQRIKYRYPNNPTQANGGKPCDGSNSFTEQAPCVNLQPCQTPVNGMWSNWALWVDFGTPCTATCGTSASISSRRTRSCSNPRPSNGGQDCSGSSEQSRLLPCSSGPCPVNGQWSMWTAWGSVTCPTTCGDNVQGTRSQMRFCTSPPPSNGGRSCDGDDTKTEFAPCVGIPNCVGPINGMWSNWGLWFDFGTPCTATCGTSATISSRRTRSCSNPRPSNGGQDCSGSSEQSRVLPCSSGPCPVNGQWSMWTAWGSVTCPTTCGDNVQGTRSQRRSCTSPPPSNGGRSCDGDDTKTEFAPCVGIPNCAVPNVWGNWEPWGSPVCSESCGTSASGPRTRSRTCISQPCTGNDSEVQIFSCGLSKCSKFTEEPVDTVTSPGGVHVFTVRTVESGIQGTWYKNNITRLSSTDRISIETDGNTHRLIIRDVKLSDSGQYSFTVNDEATSAYLTVSGEIWGEWSPLSTSACSVTCGKGEITSTRRRTCQGGSSCPGIGEESDVQECAMKNCATTPEWYNDGNKWLIAAIGAVIIIGIALLILIIACCICQCRKKKPKPPTSVGTASWDMDDRQNYFSGAKYNDPKLNGSEYMSTMIQ